MRYKKIKCVREFYRFIVKFNFRNLIYLKFLNYFFVVIYLISLGCLLYGF